MYNNTMNLHQIVGRLVQPPELKDVGQGKTLLTFRLAYDTRRTTDAEGSHSNFIDVEYWGNKAPELLEKLQKGMQVIAHGELVQRRWKNAEGQNRSLFRISAERVDICDLKRRVAEPSLANA